MRLITVALFLALAGCNSSDVEVDAAPPKADAAKVDAAKSDAKVEPKTDAVVKDAAKTETAPADAAKTEASPKG